MKACVRVIGEVDEQSCFFVVGILILCPISNIFLAYSNTNMAWSLDTSTALWCFKDRKSRCFDWFLH